jgi:large subunit ribosomal protein L5
MRLKEFYKKEITQKLKKDFGYKNELAVPRMEKVTVNVGMGQGLKDPKFFDLVEKTLTKITGQKPVPTKAKKSISSFKIRKDMNIGMKVTLRGRRMYDFVEKLVHVVLPRVRDFRGLEPESMDKRGNLSLGIQESHVFPEIEVGEAENSHSLQITITTTAKTKEEGFALFKYLGLPFRTK